MEFIGMALGLITTPLAWPIAILIIVVLALIRGWLIPRTQADALIEQHKATNANQKEMIDLIRADRDRSMDAMVRERDLWKVSAENAQSVAQQVRDQNGDLIDRLEIFDYMLTAMRQETGVQGGESDD